MMIGNRLAFDEVGSGPAVVLLHGFPFDRSMWRAQIDFLCANGFRAIAPNLRGLGADHGKTERQAEAYRTVNTMDDMARDVAALMDELKIDQAVICGLSMGGYVTLEFAHLFPTRVRALVLAGTRAPADNEQEKQAREQQAEKILNEGMNGVAEATLPKLLAPRTLSEKPEVIDHVREMILHSNPHCAVAAQRGMAVRRDYSDDLSDIEVPALIIVGREDPIRPVADAEFMHNGIRHSRLEVIEDAAHMTNLEQPEVFNKVLVSFLEALADTAGASPHS
jgi:3-oxoadipate enol-lactonase